MDVIFHYSGKSRPSIWYLFIIILLFIWMDVIFDYSGKSRPSIWKVGYITKKHNLTIPRTHTEPEPLFRYSTSIQTSRNKFIWLVKQYEVKKSYITTKTLIPSFDISISSRDFHQKKLVLSSSQSTRWSATASRKRHDSTDNCLRLDS